MIDAPPQPRPTRRRRVVPILIVLAAVIVAGQPFLTAVIQPSEPTVLPDPPTPTTIFSTDLRSDWRTVELPGTDESVVAVTTGSIFVGTATGTWWVSADNGATWSLASHQDPAFRGGTVRAATAYRSGLIAVGYSFTAQHPSFPTIWRSTDAREWTASTVAPEAGYLVDVAADGGELLAIGNVDRSGAVVWKFDGAGWTPGDFVEGNFPLELQAVVRAGTGWYVAGTTQGGNAGVWHSVDGGSWALEEGLEQRGAIVSLAVDGNGSLVALSQPTALWQRSGDGSWSQRQLPELVIPPSGVQYTPQGWVVYGEAGITDADNSDQAFVTTNLRDWDTFFWQGRVEHLSSDLVAVGSVGGQPAVWNWPNDTAVSVRVSPGDEAWRLTGLPDMAREARYLPTGGAAIAIFDDELFLSAPGVGFNATGIRQDMIGAVDVAGERYLYDSTRTYRLPAGGGVRPSPAEATFAIQAIRYLDGSFVAIGANDESEVVATSQEGVRWETSSVNVPEGPVYTTAGAFVVYTEEGIRYSVDGSSWKTKAVPAGGSPWQLTPERMALAYSDQILISDNGSDWMVLTNPIGQVPAALWSGGGRLLLAADGQIWIDDSAGGWDPIPFGRSDRTWYTLVTPIPDAKRIMVAATDHGRPVVLEWVPS